VSIDTTATDRPTDTADLGEEILQVNDLKMHFPLRRGASDAGGQVIRAVDGVTFTLHRGETLGLVGESGCGKSTLARTILGLHRPSSGAIWYRGMDLATLSNRKRRPLRRHVQVVFQDPYTSLDPRMTVSELIAEPLRINHLYSPERVSELFSYVGLDEGMGRRNPSEFSGGQRQRIGIARALALSPEILILDEPVSALDVSIQAQVLNLLQRLQAELGLTYIFIGHDLSVVRHVSRRVAVMYLGKIVEIGESDDIFGRSRHPYTRALLSAIPVPDPRGRDNRRRIALRGEPPDPSRPPEGCSFHTRCPQATPACSADIPNLTAIKASGRQHLSACFHADDLAGDANASVPPTYA
jgi:oligopeptide/dipeptide ABC transporter ATP-binding protein